MKNNKGFTLIEIAIVLVIIGLLLGGIIKGRTFIESAKIKNIIKQAESVSAAVYAYQDRYSYYPGDDNTANARWGLPNGNGNGQITEWQNAPRHLEAAGLITGSYTGSNTIVHRYGGSVYIYYQNIGGYGAGNLIRFDNLPGDAAEALDAALDDGIYNTGSVRGNAAYTSATVGQTAYYF